VELLPGHIDDGDADAYTVGDGFTVTFTDAWSVHPSVEPVT